MGSDRRSSSFKSRSRQLPRERYKLQSVVPVNGGEKDTEDKRWSGVSKRIFQIFRVTLIPEFLFQFPSVLPTPFIELLVHCRPGSPAEEYVNYQRGRSVNQTKGFTI